MDSYNDKARRKPRNEKLKSYGNKPVLSDGELDGRVICVRNEIGREILNSSEGWIHTKNEELFKESERFIFEILDERNKWNVH